MKCQLVTIDLAEPFQPVVVDYGYPNLAVLVCDGGSPLGQLMYQTHDISGFLLSAERLEADVVHRFGWEVFTRSKHLRSDVGTLSTDPLPAITVAICTKDRPLSLDRCLAALGRVTYPNFEILVIDNGSKDPDVQTTAAKHQVRCVVETNVGLDWARNRAIEDANHHLIAFCDDDVVVSPRWLHGIAKGFLDPRTAMVTGLVLAAEVDTRWQGEFERYGGMAKGFTPFDIKLDTLPEEEYFTSSRWGVGANMAIRRNIAKEVGMFDVGLDVGTPSGGGGDIEMMWRVVSAGHNLRYEPNAWVRHAHRRDRSSLIRQIHANGRSYGCFLQSVVDRDPAMSKLVRSHARIWMTQWLARQLVVGVRNRDRFATTLAWAEFRGAMSCRSAYRQTRAIQHSDKPRLPKRRLFPGIKSTGGKKQR